MKKIVFITNGLSGGGAERVMSTLANWLVNNGHEVTFLSLKYMTEAYRIDKRISLIYKSRVNKSKDFVGDISFIRKYMKKNKEAVYISFFTRQNMYAIIASLFMKINIIVSERSDPKLAVGSRIEDKFRSILYKMDNCKKIVFQSHGAMRFFDANIQKKGCILLNPLITNLPIYQDTNSMNMVIACGRLTKQKNYPLLINAFGGFVKEHPEYTLCIYGEGELENKLNELIKSYGLENRVFLKGFSNNIHDELLKGSMFVMSSDYEGLSNALLEAMAIGIPCVSTDSTPGGAREVLENGENGLLVPINDCDALTKAMCYMADSRSEALKMGKNAMKLRDELNEDNICWKWLQIIEGL